MSLRVGSHQEVESHGWLAWMPTFVGMTGVGVAAGAGREWGHKGCRLSTSSPRRRGCGFTFELQHSLHEDLGGRSEVKAFAWRCVVGC